MTVEVNAAIKGVLAAVTALVKPLVLAQPVPLELTFMNAGQAQVASGLPGIENVDSTTLRFS